MKIKGKIIPVVPLYWHESESMGHNTLSDCIRCPYMAECDVYITHGVHKHLEGLDPCELVFEPGSDEY
jgi:hypothetical protein